MKNYYLFALLLLTFNSCKKANDFLILPDIPEIAPTTQTELLESIEYYLDEINNQGYDGIVGVKLDGQPNLIHPLGMADRATKHQVSTTTIFPIGSLTKAFIGAGIVLLAQQKKLQLADKISLYLPNVPTDKSAITIHQLLTHTSGFPVSLGVDSELITKEDFISKALQTNLAQAPATGYLYSNVGYSIAAAIMEAVIEIPHEVFIQKNILNRTNATPITYTFPNNNQDDLAVGYEGDQRWGTLLEQPRLSDGPSWHLRGNGGLLATTEAVFNWITALTDKTIFNTDSQALIFQKHVQQETEGSLFYGYGWDVATTSRGTKVVNHDGSNGIYYARITWWQEEGFLLFTASNQANQPYEALHSNLNALIINYLNTL